MQFKINEYVAYTNEQLKCAVDRPHTFVMSMNANNFADSTIALSLNSLVNPFWEFSVRACMRRL